MGTWRTKPPGWAGTIGIRSPPRRTSLRPVPAGPTPQPHHAALSPADLCRRPRGTSHSRSLSYVNRRSLCVRIPSPQHHSLFDPSLPGERQLIVADVESAQTSCGFAVSQFKHRGDRTLLNDWAEKKGPDGIAAYWAEKNTRSIDGLPTGLPTS